MSPPPTATAGSPPAAPAPTPEAFEALRLQVVDLQAKLTSNEKVSLDGERERILATYPGLVSKEAAAKCVDLGSLQALESVARAAGSKRTGADPAQAAGVADARTAPNLPDSTAKLQESLAARFGIVPTPGVKA